MSQKIYKTNFKQNLINAIDQDLTSLGGDVKKPTLKRMIILELSNFGDSLKSLSRAYLEGTCIHSLESLSHCPSNRCLLSRLNIQILTYRYILNVLWASLGLCRYLPLRGS